MTARNGAAVVVTLSTRGDGAESQSSTEPQTRTIALRRPRWL